MRKVYTCESLFEAHHVKNILELNEIECFLKNDKLSALVGEVPTVSVWPELWVLDDTQAYKAKNLIENEVTQRDDDLKDWHCPGCCENNVGSFQICWNCNHSRIA